MERIIYTRFDVNSTKFGEDECNIYQYKNVRTELRHTDQNLKNED